MIYMSRLPTSLGDDWSHWHTKLTKRILLYSEFWCRMSLWYADFCILGQNNLQQPGYLTRETRFSNVSYHCHCIRYTIAQPTGVLPINLYP